MGAALLAGFIAICWVASIVCVWACMPRTIGDVREKGKATPLGKNGSNVGGTDAARH